jgi:hypothetical protein
MDRPPGEQNGMFGTLTGAGSRPTYLMTTSASLAAHIRQSLVQKVFQSKMNLARFLLSTDFNAIRGNRAHGRQAVETHQPAETAIKTNTASLHFPTKNESLRHSC